MEEEMSTKTKETRGRGRPAKYNFADLAKNGDQIRVPARHDTREKIAIAARKFGDYNGFRVNIYFEKLPSEHGKGHVVLTRLENRKPKRAE